MKASINEIAKRTTQFDKNLGVIANGSENSYPEKSERFILNSVTAKMAAGVMASYLAGAGFGADDNIKVNSKGLTLKKLSQTIAKSFSKQRGAFIHFNYNALFEPIGVRVLPYTDCRLGKKDDNEYNGKIVVLKDWVGATKRDVADKGRVVDVFNPDKGIVAAQIEAAGGINNYQGQIWHVNLDEEFVYALSQIDSVENDCDSEAQASIFKNRSLRVGFFGKTMVVTKPLSGNLEDYDTPEHYQLALSERDAFKGTIDEFISADNAGGVLHIELDQDGDDLNDAIKFENIASDIDDKLFEHTEKSVFQNILVAFNNIPAGLVRSDSALFSASGDSLQIMKETYQENTSLERSVLEETVNVITNIIPKINKSVVLMPLIPIAAAEQQGLTEDELIQKKAQATLKGSVGGVQALLSIQQGVTAGTTDREAARTIIEELFGVSEELASKMLGTPKEEEGTDANTTN